MGNILPVMNRYDVILINAPSIYNYNNSPYIYKRSIPPLGLGYIGTFLSKRGIKVGIIDAEMKYMSVDEIVKEVREISPQIVGINCSTPNLKMSYRLVSCLSKLGMEIVVGGPHILGYPEEFSKSFKRVVSVAGFGEEPMAELIKTMNFKTRNIIINNMATREIIDLIVDRSFFDNNIGNDYDIKEAVMIGSRGCYETCSYCIGNKTQFAFRSLNSIGCEILELLNNYGVELIHFLDELAFPNNVRLNEFIETAKYNNIAGKFVWRGLISVCALQRIDINLLEKSDCVRLSMGIESGCDRILKLIGKNYTKSDVLKLLLKISKSNIKLKLFFMVGIPTETVSEIYETREFIKLCSEYKIVDEINVFQYKPYVGTKLFERYFKDKRIKYKYFDLRSRIRDELSPRVDKALGKDFYFCEHECLPINLKKVQEAILEMVTGFYYCRENI